MTPQRGTRPPGERRSRTRVDPARRRAGRLASGYAALVVRARYLIVAGWLTFAALATLWLPGLGSGSDLTGFIGSNDPAVRAEVRSFELFGFPLLSRVVLVQRDPAGLSPYTQAAGVLRAIAIDQGSYPDSGLLAAIPVPNTLGAFPGSRESGTTLLTYVFADPRRSLSAQRDAAAAFAARHLTEPADHYVGVTGSVPARDEQARLIGESLRFIEISTVLAIALIVGVNFGSVVAPLMTLATAGLAAVVTTRVAGLAGALLGIAVPAELEPLIVALLLGVVTDYSIFFLSALRRRVGEGARRRDGARQATAEFAPIVAVAGVTVAAGTAALLAAKSALFRGLGPALALTVLVGLLVAITLIPALMALVGRYAFWPSRPGPSAEMPGPGPARLAAGAFRGGFLRRLTRRPVAAAVAVGCLAALLAAGAPLRSVDLGVDFVQSLPSGNRVARAAAAAEAGFAPGILSPTEVLVVGPAVGQQRAALGRLQAALAAQPGVAGVLGAGTLPVPAELGVFVARSGDAARYLVVLRHPPLGAAAVDALERLRQRLPVLVRSAGLGSAQVSVAGDTALAAGIVARTGQDLVRIALAAAIVNLLLLALFLRALVAPLYLLASSVLALTAGLGLTTFVFQHLLGYSGLTFYVPFAAAVLLVALGSDYNIFAVGHIWEEARERPLAAAIAVAVPQSTRAITAAGITLAVSFGLLAIVPLTSFAELAFAMFVGILLDAVVVRSLLVPSLLVLVGPVSGWPGRRVGTG